MQYSQRDPNRDKTHGRIYRLVYPERPLVEPVTQHGKPVAELLEQLRAKEWRTRYRVRRELRDRSWEEVAAALTSWLGGLKKDDPEFDRLRCEALWIQESHHRLDLSLLQEVAAKASRMEARAAAVHLITDARERIPSAEALLIAASADSHPRVRTEAARGLSFFPTQAAMKAVFEMLKLPEDYWCDYTIYHTLGANQEVWNTDYLAGRMPSSDRATSLLTELFASSELDKQAFSLIADAHRTELPQEQRNKAMTSLADLTGGLAKKGAEVFKRNCANCHLIGNEGRDFGPNLSDVGKRLARFKLVESLVHPNAELEEKYRTTVIQTLDGLVISGLKTAETDVEVEIYDGKESKKIAKEDIDQMAIKAQSSMPDDLAVAMSPSEFIHLMQYLSEQQTAPEKK
jgi:putative heme-binding domain-containing protein